MAKKDISHGYGSYGSYYSSGSGFVTKEAYKSLRTNIQFLLVNEKSNIVAFSSANIGEGKSTTCVNAAITMVESGAKVLLIDADLRRPVLHKMMDVDIQPGFTDYVSGKLGIAEIIRPSQYPKLDICTCGPLPPNPAELLGSEKMSGFLSEVSKVYDYVFIDTPPITVVTDALVLAKQIAGYIFIVRQGYCDTDMLKEAIQNSELVDAKILGIVLNDVKQSKMDYGYSKYGKRYGRYGKYGKYGGYYGYGYGYGYGSSNEKKVDDVAEVTEAKADKKETE